MVLNLFTVNILLEIFRFNITATSVFSDFKFLSLNRVTKLFCSNRWCSRSPAHYECRIPKGSPAFWGLQKTPQVLDNMHRFWYVLLWFTRVKKERKEKRSHFTLLWWSVEVSCCCCSKGTIERRKLRNGSITLSIIYKIIMRAFLPNINLEYLNVRVMISTGSSSSFKYSVLFVSCHLGLYFIAYLVCVDKPRKQLSEIWRQNSCTQFPLESQGPLESFPLQLIVRTDHSRSWSCSFAEWNSRIFFYLHVSYVYVYVWCTNRIHGSNLLDCISWWVNNE